MEITKEHIEEYIALCKIDMGKECVEWLASLRDDVKDDCTKKLLQWYIDEYSEEYKICPRCFSSVDAVWLDEVHNELDCCGRETLFNGYECEVCGLEFEY